ncbi:hypothetical protein MCEREM30_00003 [Paracoccaceae bacterium]
MNCNELNVYRRDENLGADYDAEYEKDSAAELLINHLYDLEQSDREDEVGQGREGSVSFSTREEFDQFCMKEYGTRHLQLTDEACEVLIEGCEYGRKWINSDFLFEVQRSRNLKGEPSLGYSAIYFKEYETAIFRSYLDVVTEFRAKNPKLREFCDFFERVMRKTYGITAESDQVTSS